jgi:hypothetical protein
VEFARDPVEDGTSVLPAISLSRLRERVGVRADRRAIAVDVKSRVRTLTLPSPASGRGFYWCGVTNELAR